MDTSAMAGIWHEFLGRLNTDDQFDIDLRRFLECIRRVSEIKREDLSDEGKDKIDADIKAICTFIDEYKDEYDEISQTVGFRPRGLIEDKMYYFYIADQKVKASVYYARYLNFLNHMSKANVISVLEKARADIDEILRKPEDEETGKILEAHAESLKKCIDQQKGIGCSEELQIEEQLEDLIEGLETVKAQEGLKKMRGNYIDALSIIASTDISYLKYILFNNMMKEIRYVGASFQYLWHWRKKKHNLYRAATQKTAWEKVVNKGCNKREYMKEMFSDCISHMNSPQENHRSYSENPYLDIFKYLVLRRPADSKKITAKMGQDGKLNFESETSDKIGTVIFTIVKNANLNTIRWNEKYLSFYEFIQKREVDIQSDSIKFLFALTLIKGISIITSLYVPTTLIQA